jgi:signal transduction histidine kinase
MPFAVRSIDSGFADSFLKSILDSVDFGILLTDLDHRALACNLRFGHLWGVDIESVVKCDAESVRRMVGHRIKDQDSWLENLENIYAKSDATQLDVIRLTTPERVLSRFTGPVLNDAGDPIGRLWTFYDVTDREQHERMRDVLNEISLEFDPDPVKVYRSATESVARFYDSIAFLSIRQGPFLQFRAVGGARGLSKILPGNLMSASYCKFCLESQDGIIIQDARRDRKYANTVPFRSGLIRYAGVPLKNPAGARIGTFCIMDNRSEEILGQEDLRFLSLVAMRISSELERERQLGSLRQDLKDTNRRLIQSEKLAVTGTLSAAIAHDIRNILTAISLDVSLGKDQPKETLAAVQTHLERFDLLAHRLLSFVRTEESSLDHVDLAKSIARVAELLAGHLRITGTKLDVKCPEGLPEVLIDGSRVDHLLVNLCLNAIQSMGKGGEVEINVRLAGKTVELTVSDSGAGIKPDRMSTIFEPFVSSKSDGVGLGLYSCQEIVRSSGGSIEVESELGKGTRFIVRLRAK